MVSSEKVTPKLVNGKWLIALFLFLIVLNHWVVLLIFPVKRAWSGIGLILDHRVVLLVFPVKRARPSVGFILDHGVVLLFLPVKRTWSGIGLIFHHGYHVRVTVVVPAIKWIVLGITDKDSLSNKADGGGICKL